MPSEEIEKPVVPVPTDSPAEGIPLQSRIENIFGMLIRVTTTPTWTPRSFYEGFAIDTTNNRFYWYDFTDNEWNYTSSVEKITKSLTAGENIAANDAVIVASGNMVSNTITQTTNNSQAEVYSTNWYGQTFQTSANTVSIIGVKLKFVKEGAPGSVAHVFLYATSGGLPTGTNLVDHQVTPASVSADVDEYTYTFSSPVAVSPSTTYAIVVAYGNADSTNNIHWYYNSTSVYANGSYVSSTDSGTNWTADTGKDFYFKVQESYHTAGRVYKADGSDDSELSTNFIGFATAAITSGSSGSIQVGGVVTGFTSLTKGVPYYLSGTAGGVTSTRTYPHNVGWSVSDTEILIGEELLENIILTASDNLKTSADTEQSQVGVGYTKKKEIRFYNSGTVRVTFDMKVTPGGANAFGRIYVNDVAVGTSQTNTSATYINYSEDISVNAGDKLQLYIQASNPDTCYIRNFRASYDKSLASIDSVITN